MSSRRGFLAAIAALPLLRHLVPTAVADPVPAQIAEKPEPAPAAGGWHHYQILYANVAGADGMDAVGSIACYAPGGGLTLRRSEGDRPIGLIVAFRDGVSAVRLEPSWQNAGAG